jgi:hypothetical protein
LKKLSSWLTVRRIVGRVQVDRDPPGATVPATPMLGDHRAGQPVADADQIVSAHRVLEAREGRRRAQGGPRQRLAVEHHLVHRVVGEPGGVVAIEIAGGQAKDPLPDQVEQRVRDLARLPGVRQARRDRLRQPPPLVHRLEQNQAAIRAGVGHVEPSHDRRPKTLGSERQLGYSLLAIGRRSVRTPLL